MRRIIFGAIASVLLLAGTADAGILVGTLYGDNDDVTNVQALIDAYNSEIEDILPDVVSEYLKVEWDNPEFDPLNFTDFQFYNKVDSNEDILVDIFNAEDLQFKEINSVGDLAGNPILGFHDKGVELPFDYYVAKNGNGFSLWTYMSGDDMFNPMYKDDDTGGFTRGDTSNTQLVYDPLGSGSGASHLTFYTAELPDDPDTVIPEPATMAIWGMLTGFGALFGYRKRKLTAVTA